MSTGSLLLLAGLAALGALAANIILPAFPDIGTELRAAATASTLRSCSLTAP
ncbi:hypothetical protein [Piscinibacter sp. XHJ-5]|uniref:hypothetical protein n=1 Tax=Piscinibacter sp. XHJ-5 TaxID=3037797 RepID=UPI0024530CEF|nr:hypothetical protein [Piscinibacter sp. XHJ-5]